MRQLRVRREQWDFRNVFTISRGSRTSTRVVLVELSEGNAVGRGECLPYPRYGESAESVVTQIESIRQRLTGGCDRLEIQQLLPPGAARNAVDCALWDLEAKSSGERVWQKLGMAEPGPVLTSFTLSLGSPRDMAEQARARRDWPILKAKIAGSEDLARIEAIHDAAPDAELVLDANEALTIDALAKLVQDLPALNVKLIEQPVRADDAAELESFESPIPLCADESLHTRADLDVCARRYQLINIKLDKTGGLTEAFALLHDAKAAGLGVMVGCMAATSLSLAPAVLLAQHADRCDLDAPLFLAADRVPGLAYEGPFVCPPLAALWG